MQKLQNPDTKWARKRAARLSVAHVELIQFCFPAKKKQDPSAWNHAELRKSLCVSGARFSWSWRGTPSRRKSRDRIETQSWQLVHWVFFTDVYLKGRKTNMTWHPREPLCKENRPAGSGQKACRRENCLHYMHGPTGFSFALDNIFAWFFLFLGKKNKLECLAALCRALLPHNLVVLNQQGEDVNTSLLLVGWKNILCGKHFWVDQCLKWYDTSRNTKKAKVKTIFLEGENHILQKKKIDFTFLKIAWAAQKSCLGGGGFLPRTDNHTGGWHGRVRQLRGSTKATNFRLLFCPSSASQHLSNAKKCPQTFTQKTKVQKYRQTNHNKSSSYQINFDPLINVHVNHIKAVPRSE